MVGDGSGKDILQGGSVDDIIDGGSGNDILAGWVCDTWNGKYNGAGNDSYLFGRGSGQDWFRYIDSTVGNMDKIVFSASYRIEQLQFAGGSNIDGILLGSNGNDNLSGTIINNYLFGGVVGDTLLCGLGNDYFVVGSYENVIFENNNKGYDSVLSSVTYTLSNNVEDLSLTGTAVINATGNTLNNILEGNSDNNTLNGDEGDDTLKVQTGNDSVNGGTGNDVLYGGDVIDAVPTTLVNQLMINAKANLLNNGASADTLTGGTGTGTGNDKRRLLAVLWWVSR